MDPVLWQGFDPQAGIEALGASFLNRPAWHADALCHEYPAGWWFAPGDPSRAVDVCAQCLSLHECHRWSLAQGPDLEGTWAGLTRRQRRQIRAGDVVTFRRPIRQREVIPIVAEIEPDFAEMARWTVAERIAWHRTGAPPAA